MSKIFCFGELLLRFSPTLDGKWIQQQSMPVFIGGAELNVAKALAHWEIPVAFGTALPDNYLAKEIISSLLESNVDVSRIIYSGDRIGSYYLPQGADLKNGGLIYDRAYSSFWDLKPGHLNWEELLKDINWFHFSAISPALNANVAAVCKEGVLAASKKGITISVDLNYRKSLWRYGKEPYDVMPELAQYCHVIMGNLWSAEKMLGIPVPKDLAGKDAYIEQSLKTSQEISKQFTTCFQVANTFRFDVNHGINYYGTLYVQNKMYSSREHHTTYILDKIGSGDAFMAGILYSHYNAFSPQQTIEFAAATAFNKLFIKGDSTSMSVEEIKNLLMYV